MVSLKIISTVILRLTGGVTLLFAIVGIILGLYSISFTSDIDPASFKISPEEYAETTPQLDYDALSDYIISKAPDIIYSTEHKIIYWCMVLIGLVFNALLFFVGYHLFRSRIRYSWWFIGLMVFIASYFYGLAYGFGLLNASGSLSESMALSFGGAWGVGNLGLSLILGTYFWLWGTLLVGISVAGTLISRNKAP